MTEMLPAFDDSLARERIVTELDMNMLVEAGAGSGKTTSLVARMMAYVARGVPVDRIAAVTFTHKAANELRERFQLELEKRVRDESTDSELGGRFDRALRELDRAFLGTIHAFCGRLLRERPLEVALDPNFQEVSDEDWSELKESFWRRWVERAKLAGDEDVKRLSEVGVDPRELNGAFSTVMSYPDVDFALVEVDAPDVAPCRRALEALLARARAMMPRQEPLDGWDSLMGLVRQLEFQHRIRGWHTVVAFCDTIDGITDSRCKVTQKRWGDTKDVKTAAKNLGEDFASLLAGPITSVLQRWREHRYPLVMRILQRAGRDFERERLLTGQLGFEDLLALAAKLLREHPSVRDELGGRFAHLLVDEFQDTDPIQAEVCFLLASSSDQGNDWHTVVPRPGALFVVGDPKQSIYRFRRADIQTYELVKQRLSACGAVLALTRNFRSVRPIGTFVNDYFQREFPTEATAEQAPFSEMQTTKDADGVDGIYSYSVCPDENNKNAILDADAAMLSSWIAERIASGARSAGDFLILTATKQPIESYARALALRNVPATTTGAQLPQEHELEELLIVLRAIADPENSVAVVAALEGLFFGMSPSDLFDAHRLGIRFVVTHAPPPEAHRVASALLVLHEWWSMAQRHAADVLVERILGDTGLLFHAAGQILGDARAGALLHLVESLRSASTLGDSGLTNAMERIAVLLRSEAADAPLRPGLVDAVRIMNLHKAKGLEAEVVILAAPLDRKEHAPTIHVVRGAGAQSTGGVVIEYKEGGIGSRKFRIAQPVGWAEMEESEARFIDAEEARLLYVAATRAKRELIVARCERENSQGPVQDESLWSALGISLDSLAKPMRMRVSEAPGRRRAERTAAEMKRATSAAHNRLTTAAAASLRVVTVTESAKVQHAERLTYDLPSSGEGAAWGRAVHRGLEAMGRGRRGEALDSFVKAVARDEKLSEEQSVALTRQLLEVERSASWQSLIMSSGPQFELAVMSSSHEGGVETITEGVIDAVGRTGEGWEVIDWKTDAVSAEQWEQRLANHARQADRYGSILAGITGAPVTARIERVRPALESGSEQADD
ncbi:MAG: UvrD-helicase domain-containing protein [Gemmatimonadaceae bacterium]